LDNPDRARVPRESAVDLERLFDRLWPLNRSLTGEGVRRTHAILGELVPLRQIEMPSGSRVFDWQVPPEWVLREAYIVAPDGRRLLDVAQNNLHLVGYSEPFRGRLSREDLEPHLHSLPALPQAVPYVTSYYARRWGFCLSEELRRALPPGNYDVVVDTELRAGSLTLAESVLPGESTAEVLFSTYTCHPSMANNELSGPLVAAFLHRRLAALPNRRLTYRFVFAPETIGAIVYLSLTGEHLRSHMLAGYVLTCIGNRSPLTLKRSRRGDSAADRAATHLLRQQPEHRIVEFYPSGSDERQYCSPGFNLPVAVLTRDLASYPEYHTSLDNKSIMDFEGLVAAVDLAFDICCLLERNRAFRGTVMQGEPFLSRYNLQSTLGARRERDRSVEAIKWLLNFSDGAADLLAIAERADLPFWDVAKAAEACIAAGLLIPVD